MGPGSVHKAALRHLNAVRNSYKVDSSVLSRTISPSLLVFMSKVRANSQCIIEKVGGPNRWRPHLKTTKLPSVWRELYKQGVKNYKCATCREARVFLESLDAELREGWNEGEGDSAAAADLLVAYPALGPNLEEVANLAAQNPWCQISILCDHTSAPERVTEAKNLGVYVDVNPGMNRTGIPYTEREAILEICAKADDQFKGIHFYEGHMTELSFEKRREKAFEGYDRLFELLEYLVGNGISISEVVTSGTPSFTCAIQYPSFGNNSFMMGGQKITHRVSPGTVVFSDHRSEMQNPGLGLQPAAVVYSRVISHPTPNIVTFDAGSKSLAAEVQPVAFVMGHADVLTPLTPSEEHFPQQHDDLSADDVERLFGIGSGHLLVPSHICPTVNLAEKAVIIDGDENETLYSVTDVRARAHDVGWGGSMIIQNGK
mmetsp:Transcript_41065/g.66052  ORF Transcript_41065/g.66052 Transcript_41065/m.66052 type:complete len:430 (+) Transcript_41065:1428-2717(+)|eukprot:jgi/Bigna1/77028/fgenesh1_pg.45_\